MLAGLVWGCLLGTALASNLDPRAACNRDNCLRAFVRKSAEAIPFCSTFTKAPASTPFPTYATACTGNQTSRMTSACSCLTTSSGSSSATSTTSSSSTSTSSTSTVPATPTCTPSFVPAGVSEEAFNKKDTPFSLKLSCSQLDVKNVTAYANLVPVENMTATAEGVSFPGFKEDYVLLSVFAVDVQGVPFIKTYQLLFGNIDMPVLVLGSGGNPASDVLVQANSTIYPGVTQSCTTDSSGKCTVVGLIATTISLIAKTANNSLGLNGLAATPSLVTLQLVPFTKPKEGASFDIGNGTTGWDGGAVSQTLKVKRDTTLVVSTNGQPSIQTARNSFPVRPFTKTAYITYKFVTSEVPGGYFGSQFNDYYSITIRSDTGAFATVTNSMNALGLGAFDANGATDWYTLSLSVPPNTKSVSYDIGVSNVGDSALQSSVIVQKVGDLQCEKCGDCASCPSDPMCQSTCTNPPYKSCGFYRNCFEGQLGCGPTGYPLYYGERNCQKFVNNIEKFSPAGTKWVYDTMYCLQQHMVPLLKPCTGDCGSMASAAFASHPKCYVDSGVCGLGCQDVVAVFLTVGGDLLPAESRDQMLTTFGLCLENITQTLQGCGGTVLKLTAEIILLFLTKKYTKL